MGALLNRRRYMGVGSSLPYDAEIEYLQATGIQYIDTGYIPKDNTELEIRYTITKLASNLRNGIFPYGCRVAFINHQYNIFSPVNQVNECHVCYGNEDRHFIYSPLNQDILVHADGSKVTFAGTDYIFSPGNLPSLNIFLFGLNSNGTFGSATNMELNIKYFWIKEGGRFIINMVPVRIGQTGYMYDKVSGQLFGNAGAGSFILGPDKT